MADQTLKVLRRIATESQDAQRLWKTTGQAEDKAEAAFNEFHMNLNERTVLKLIDDVEMAHKAAELFVWLAANGVVATESAGSVRNSVVFSWSDPADRPRGLGQAIQDAIAGKSQILLAGG